MFRKIIFIFAMVVILCCGLALNLKAQSSPQDLPLAPELSARLNKLEAKIDQLSSVSAANHKEIMQKLDSILKSQAEMQDQIYKIKVRSSR